MHDLRALLDQPRDLLGPQAEVEHADRHLGTKRAYRCHRVTEQGKIAAVGGTDDDQARD
jgi:hypothetical protein